ncbi:telomere-capping, CST complex subunit-domain-containing protein [Zychaea mexicana]|uniref:telomere-capping, CST complex subunit-domain-containing protein n=1 Tax=Zychaea mexicana TaxID=64656 RepID=UPI0022FEF69C|nr:telomere-capping, CST complex subunit-domain-containing protein [Zychaea mexicana]KAI9495142.1 telomere-capping, CST complex subunit-domain-containing protein [Zychaea mexicana]
MSNNDDNDKVVPSGELVLHLNEITRDPKANVGRSVRVKGFLKEFQPANNRAVLEYEDAELHLNTDIIDPFPFALGRLIECIGELDLDNDDNEEQQQNQAVLVLRPRIARDIDTLDMKLFEKAGQYKRQYLEKFKSTSTPSPSRQLHETR